MADKLVVDDSGLRGAIRLTWVLEEEDDLGGSIGDGYDPKDPEPDRGVDVEAWESWAAERAALPFRDPDARHEYGFEFATTAKAKAALAAIKIRWTAKRPLYEWEQKAIAANWKPPKGWTGAT